MTKEILLWWVALTGLWLCTVSAVSVPECAAAVVLAYPCALAARAARRATGWSWAPRPGWARWFAVSLRGTLAETRAILRVRARGRLETRRLPDEPRAKTEARQAIATVAIGLSPGSMVVDSPPGDRVLVVHRLLDRPSAVLDEVSR